MEESKSRSVMDDRVRVKRDNSDTLYSRKCHNRNILECMDLSIDNEDERKLVDEVLRIKSILDKKKGDVEYASWAVYDSLKKLQKMVLSVKILKITMIGCSVSALKKHDFKHVSGVARMLVKNWRRVADEWVAAIEEKSVVNQEQQNMLTSNPQTPYSESVYNLQHMGDIQKETAIEKTVSVLRTHVSKNVSETTRTLVKEWKDMVNETTENGSSIVKKVSERAETQKGSIACNQQYKPVASRVETGDQKGPARTIFEKNFEASKRKIQVRYKEIECMKQKRKIHMLQLSELPQQDHQIKPVNKRLRRGTNIGC